MTDINAKVSSNVNNYYGGAYVYEDCGKYFLAIEDYNHDKSEEVSKEFYDAFVTQFGNSQSVDK